MRCSCVSQVPSLDGVSPAASPRSPHRSPRRGSGLQLNPAARGPPFGDSVTLGGLIGRGASGSVYAARRNGKPVAVKVGRLHHANHAYLE